ncbi:MAG: phosphate ABC transporter, permease protein PstA [Dehalococcoidia bacterium]|nr:phosphate ABC transporter, permease protein PstA [Dehalococcoidia bacterium]|tara:strand:- start:9062 stop:9931 length:870 start_codon:yes stop_codon:yes gene_type:complete
MTTANSDTKFKLRERIDKIVNLFLGFSILIAFVTLLALVFDILNDGWKWFDWQFINSYPSRKPEIAGIKAALFGTVWVMSITALLSIPIGVCTALYLEMFAEDTRFNRFIKLNISNLAGVPSIIYGIIGMAVFVEFFQMGRVILAGSLTMTLLILPIIIIASQEAIKQVPSYYLDAALALGSTKWQAVIKVIIPQAIPGIVSGFILAMSRAIGESAPMIAISALVYLTFLPSGPLDRFTVMPIQIYNWVSQPQDDFRGLAAAGIILLLIMLLSLNSFAIFLRDYFQKRN